MSYIAAEDVAKAKEMDLMSWIREKVRFEL